MEGWPLVGRMEELDVLQPMLVPPRRGVVLAGSAGVGKTRLARELVDRRAARGDAVAWVMGTRAAATIPFGALLPLLRQPGEPLPNQLDVLRWAEASLLERAGPSGLVLGVDNAHLLDDSSAALLHLLAGSGAVRIVATVLAGEPVPDAVTSLWKDGELGRAEVLALNASDVAELLAAALGGPVDEATATRLWEVTRGNPLYLRELVGGGVESGLLAWSGSTWRWSGPLRSGPRLREVIEGRLDGLSEAARRALEILAFAEPIGARLLRGLAAPRAVDELDRRGLLGAEPGGRRMDVRLSHPLYGEVVRESVPPLRAANIQASLAEAVGATGGRRREDTLRVARWRLEAGAPGDPARLVDASLQALALFDHDLSLRLADVAILGASGDVAFSARHARGRALYAAGRYDEVMSLVPALEADAQTEEQRAIVADLSAVTLCWGLGRADEGRAVLARVSEELGRPARDLVDAEHAAIAFYSGEPAAALELAGRVLSQPDAEPRTRLLATLAMAPALAVSGQTDRAVESVSATFPLAVQLADTMPYAPVALMGSACVAHWLGGRLEQADAMAASLYSTATVQRADDAIGIFAMAVGGIALYRGRPELAASRLVEARDRLRETDIGRFLPFTLCLLAQAFAVRGRPDDAVQATDEARASFTQASNAFGAYLHLAEAWSAAARGELSAAVDLAGRAAADAEHRRQFAFMAVALHDIVRLGAPDLVVERLAALAARVDGEFAPLFAAHARASVAGDAAELERVGDALARIGALLMAAEALREAAAIHQAHGARASSASASLRADQLVGHCEGAQTPLLGSATTSAAKLTRREREIAEMAARGMSSPEIASRLVVSERTVESHLYRAFGKLGVESRAQLADVLGVPPR